MLSMVGHDLGTMVDHGRAWSREVGVGNAGYKRRNLPLESSLHDEGRVVGASRVHKIEQNRS